VSEQEIEFQVGEKIGSYTILQKPEHPPEGVAVPLGRGGMAKVYLVEQELGPRLTIRRALKLYAPKDKIANRRQDAGQSAGRHSFLQEIEAISSFTHQNLVKIIDAGQHLSDTPYFVMEYVEGADLRTLLTSNNDHFIKWKKRATDSPFQIIRMAQQICWPINYLHTEEEFFHFDIAPKNIFVREVSGRPHMLVGDLGVGRRVLSSLPNPKAKVFISGTKDYTPADVLPYLNQEIEMGELQRFAAYWDVFAMATVIDEMITAYDLATHPDLEATRQLCQRMKNRAERFSARKTSDELERLLPAHVITAGVEELSTDAVGRRRYVNIPLYSAPISDRVHAILNHSMFSRLQLSPQLLLVRSGLPGGVHTTYEHVIGSYALMIRCLTKLLSKPRFRVFFSQKEIEEALLVVLLFKLASFPLDRIFLSVVQESGKAISARELFNEFFDRPVGDASLRKEVESHFTEVDLESVLTIMFGAENNLVPYQKMILSLLRSSIDVRVLDYIVRDSHHTGIPAGIGIDVGNIIENLTWTNTNQSVGISRDGVFAVEHLLCARYWMFSRVYWNQQNRAITSMLRHVLFSMVMGNLDPKSFVRKLMDVDEARALRILSSEYNNTAPYEDAGGSILELLQQPRPHLYQSILELFARNWSLSQIELCEEKARTPAQLHALGERFLEHTALRGQLSRSDILFDLTNEQPFKLGEDVFVSLENRDGGDEIALQRASEIVRVLPRAFKESAVRLRVFCHPKIANDKATVKKIRDEAKSFLDSEFPAR
jgi:uncharacterized protein